MQWIAVEAIDVNPYQPRRHLDEAELAELTESVRTHGVLQPVVVRPAGERFQLVAGERRWRGAVGAGLERIPAVVRTCDDRAMMVMALVENLQRVDLGPLEEARAYRRLVEEFGYTQEEVAAAVGRSRSQVANYMRLLQLSAPIQAWLESGQLTVAHGKVLLGVEEPRRSALAARAAERGWTVKELEAALQPPAVRRATPDVHLQAAEARLQRRLGVRVRILGSSQRGRISVPYRSLEELERLLEILGEGEAGASADNAFVV